MRNLRFTLLLLFAGCGSFQSGEIQTRLAPPTPEAPEPAEVFELHWPAIESYEDGLAFVPDGLENALSNANVCIYNEVTDLVERDDGSTTCVLPKSAAFSLNNQTFYAGLLQDSFEHDGMYGHTRNIVLGLSNGASADASCCAVKPVALFSQWNHEVYDAYTSVLIQGYQVIELEKEGDEALCVEQIREEGVGLFEVMDMEKVQKHWTPNQRERTLHAYRFDNKDGSFKALEAENGRCPRRGYSPFIELPNYPDPVGWRADQ